MPVAALALLGTESTAQADLLAAYLQGHGGLSSVQIDGVGGGQRTGSSPAVGFQVGARILGLELYGDYTSFGGGASVERGILGLRLGFNFGDTRLELRGGGGGISEQGGGLTGIYGAANRSGVVGRAGIDLERRLSETLLIGFGVTGESFALDNSGYRSSAAGATLVGTSPRGSWITGSDIFASMHLKFEIGI